MKHALILLEIGLALRASTAPLPQEVAVVRALEWMKNNPVMKNAPRAVASVGRFPDPEDGYSFYVVRLSPTGYLVLNSDDRPPPVVSFSASSPIDLSDTPANTFRAMLRQRAEAMEARLAQPGYETPTNAPLQRQAVTEIHGPFLETSWNQCNPYNKRCPAAPDGTEYYGYRDPAGCVATAYAQLMAFHRWPSHGEGSHTYTDYAGSTTGTHSADFSDSYDWKDMLPSYDPWNPNPEVAEDAVAELIYELNVAVEANFESAGTGASPREGGECLDDYFFFEPCQWHYTKGSLMAPMEADLRAGFPCVVSIPNHAIVADGLMVDAGTTTYHFNYGWGGANNGWMDADQLTEGCTSLRPRLMAFPQSNSVSCAEGLDAEVRWILPKRREDEVAKLVIYRQDSQSGSWESFAEDTALLSRRYSAVATPWDDCADFSRFGKTSTSDYLDWEISTTSGVADCFHKPPGGYSNREYHLTSISTITPTASTCLALHAKYRLANDRFRVLISTDRSTFTEIWSIGGSVDWSDVRIDLSGQAGQAVYVRLEYVPGSYYPDGGIWIDSIGTLEVTHPELEGQPVHYTVLQNLTEGSYTLAAKLVDTNLSEHALGPAFTLEITGDGDGMPATWELQYGLDPDVDDGTLDPDGDGYNNLDEYICGTDPTNAASQWVLEPGSGNLPCFHTVEGRLYTIQYRTSLKGGSWLPLASNIQGTNGTVFVSDFDAATNPARYYRVQVQPSE